MVKVLLTGPNVAVTPKQLAATRLQGLHGTSGTYQPAAVDTVSFKRPVETQEASTRWKALNDAAKRHTKVGVVLASSLAGGLVGGALGGPVPGLLLGALFAGGLLTLQNVFASQSASKKAPVEQSNPFKTVDLTKTEAADIAEEVSPRELAVERLRSDVLDADAPPAKKAPNIKFNGVQYPIRNIANGMLPKTLNVLADTKPVLRFKTTQYVRASEIAAPPSSMNIAAHNVTEPMAVVTLGKDGSKVQLFDPAAKNPFSISNEAVVWGTSVNAP